MNHRISAVVIGALALTACSQQRPQANEWGCSFGSGPFDERGLKNTVSPGGNAGWSNDDLKNVPSDVRFYIIDSDAATADFGGRPIVVPAKGSTVTESVGIVNVSVEVQVRFVFNERACSWYVQHGKRNEPLNFDVTNDDEASGWNNFLNASFNQKLIEGARPVVRDVSYIDLYTNSDIGDGLAYDVLGQQLSANLSRELERDLGDQFFCGPTYKFDGDADGELESGCPPLEVTIKRIAPVDASLIEKLETIVANEEQKRVDQSNRDLAITQQANQQATQLAEIERQQAVELAEEARRQEVETAAAQADLAIAQAEQAVAEQETANAQVRAQAEAAFCVALAQVGVNCALYQNGYPQVLGSGDTTLLISPPTSQP